MEAAAEAAARDSGAAAVAEEEAPREAAVGSREAGAPEPANRSKMTVMQRPMEKRMKNREIILKGRSSLTGIDNKILKKKLIMKVENPRGGQISVFFSALQGTPSHSSSLPRRKSGMVKLHAPNRIQHFMWTVSHWFEPFKNCLSHSDSMLLLNWFRRPFL